MKFVNLRVRTAESVKNVSVNIDAIQSVEQLRTAFSRELDGQQQATHRAVMTYDSYKDRYICNVRYSRSYMNIITVDEDCQAVYLITLSNGDVLICLDDLPADFAELLGF